MKNIREINLLNRGVHYQRFYWILLLSVLCIGLKAQNKTISGTVVDAVGESIIGANVVIKGTTNGVITDFD